MLTYEYKCGECGHRVETFQNMSDARLTVCPECSGQLRRLIGNDRLRSFTAVLRS